MAKRELGPADASLGKEEDVSERFEVVADDCIGCGLCSERAPANFEIPVGARTARVFKQPETSEEEQACLEACDYCPVAGIKGYGG